MFTRMMGVTLGLVLVTGMALAAPLDLSKASVVVRGNAELVEQTAATVLVEEVAKRTGLRWTTSTTWPGNGPVIALTVDGDALSGQAIPAAAKIDRPEGYGIATEGNVVWIVGADANGALYGVGKLLRSLDWRQGSAKLIAPLNLTTAPVSSVRGHQLGYRPTANSYDTWDVAQYDQFIREMALFGVNAVENIPFGEDDPLMPITRKEMNRELGNVCKKYGVDYWVWTPAEVDLGDPQKRAAHIKEHIEFYKNCGHLGAVFFPGGDPGHNHPSLVLPFLQDLEKELHKFFPEAQIWMSLQGFEEEAVDYFFDWLDEHQPEWFTGAVGGPGSMLLGDLRKRLPEQYKLRDYPDITHTVRSQYATVWIDPAFAFTSGREGTNPEPMYYSEIHRATARYTDGFVTYSDGMHDDVNKTVWSVLGWDPEANLREAMVEYCRVHFGNDVAERAADGIYALERNWSGALRTNGGVESTLALWQALDAQAPQLRGNWRWQLCQLKAHYDAYIRARLLHEEALELEVNAVLAQAGEMGADAAMDAALKIFARADSDIQRPAIRERVYALCDDLFRSIGYQSSVKKYGANNGQRSAVLDYVEHPMNNRWWVEDQFAEIRDLGDEAEKIARLDVIRKWEHPGEGSFYDDIGNVSKSPHVIRGEQINTDYKQRRSPNPDFMWWDGGYSRQRPSWIAKMDWPVGLRYDGLDTAATYVIRTTGVAQCLMRVNGQLLKPRIDGKEVGALKEFDLPKELYQDGTIVLTFDTPFEPGINWRQMSRLSEVWLIKVD